MPEELKSSQSFEKPRKSNLTAGMAAVKLGGERRVTRSMSRGSGTDN